jgi:hypothetical protein
MFFRYVGYRSELRREVRRRRNGNENIKTAGMNVVRGCCEKIPE